jgi:hypothetical protein
MRHLPDEAILWSKHVAEVTSTKEGNNEEQRSERARDEERVQQQITAALCPSGDVGCVEAHERCFSVPGSGRRLSLLV